MECESSHGNGGLKTRWDDMLPYTYMKSSKAVLSSLIAASVSLLPSMVLAAPAPSIGSVQYAPNPLSGSAITLSANVSAASGIKSCNLYIDSDDKGAMNVSGNTASIQYNFAYAGVYTLFVFCRDNGASFASGPNTSIYVQGAQTQPGSGPFTGNAPTNNASQDPGAAAVPTAQTTVILPTGIAVGTLIKTECPSDAAIDHACKAVYYVGKDGKRHGFPNSKVFFTWYTDFGTVQTITASDMSAIPLGKNVTYRPGTRMVKFMTLNKVYTVSKGGVLRWVASEPVAVALYGEAWAKQIDDIPDTFYTDYIFGTDINQSGDYLVTTEQGKVLNIDDTL